MGVTAPGPAGGPTGPASVANTVTAAMEKLEELIEAVRDSTRATREKTAEGKGDLGFLGNAIRKSATSATKDVAAGMLGDAAKFGSDFSYSTSFGSSMMKAGMDTPFLNDAYFNQAAGPEQAASARVEGVMGPLARMGYDTTSPAMMKQREALRSRFLDQEQRAFAEKRVEEQELNKRLGTRYSNDAAAGVQAIEEAGANAWDIIHKWLKKTGSSVW